MKQVLREPRFNYHPIMSESPRFHSLQDFLASTTHHIDAVLNDGWDASFPVKGREIEATILFADISSFSSRTFGMSPAATLIYVQNYFAWITGEALHGRPGIVDKYIGDEVMVVFSKEFGSEDPFADAVRAAAAMSNNDALAYCPHMGIASGRVIVGYAGTAFHYNVSVFGAPVALAARCAGVKPEESNEVISSTIVFPSDQWGDRDFDDVIPVPGIRQPDGSVAPGFRKFELRPERSTEMKGVGAVTIREIHNTGMWIPTQTAEDRALESLQTIHDAGRYWPRWKTKPA